MLSPKFISTNSRLDALSPFLFKYQSNNSKTCCSLHDVKRYAPNIGTRGHCYKLYFTHARKLILSMQFMNHVMSV